MSRKRPTPKHNWNGVKITYDRDQAINRSTGLKRSRLKIHGFVTRNHASTIVRERKTHDGKIVYDLVNHTHELPKIQQASIAKLLDNPNVNKVIIYDEKN